jgi:hypothetical protein
MFLWDWIAGVLNYLGKKINSNNLKYEYIYFYNLNYERPLQKIRQTSVFRFR